MANRFVLNETSYHGSGAIQSISGEAIGRGFRKAFVCSDPDLLKFGVTKKVLDVLDQASLAYEIYSDIKPNPTIENVQSGVEAFRKSGADYIIAIGGGSSMDTAKAIGIIIANPDFADVVSLEGVAPTKNKSVPILPYRPQPERPPRSPSTTSSPTPPKTARWCAWTRRIFPLWRLSIPT